MHTSRSFFNPSGRAERSGNPGIPVQRAVGPWLCGNAQSRRLSQLCNVIAAIHWLRIRMKKGWIMCRRSPPAVAAGRGHFSRCMLATDCGPGLTCFMGFLLLCPGFKSDSGDLPVIVSSFPVWCLLKGVLSRVGFTQNWTFHAFPTATLNRLCVTVLEFHSSLRFRLFGDRLVANATSWSKQHKTTTAATHADLASAARN